MPRLNVTVNGKRHVLDVPAAARLVDVLRFSLGLTGTKAGCREGVCGSCTVLIDGQAVRSCMMPAASAAGKQITTIEGLATANRLHPLQQAFLDKEAFQCGYCTPGMILGAAALLKRDKSPAEAGIREALDGHICRCGTHPRIVEAVRLAAEVMRRG
jgi:nicotinate dehydrogenase subunit A